MLASVLTDELRKSFTRHTGLTTISMFPSKGVTFLGDRENVLIAMPGDLASTNMQSDIAAFEAWALALRCWCSVKTVTLQWSAPSFSVGGKDSPSARGHYERFCYRVSKFCELFPDWFYVDDRGQELAKARSLSSRELTLNVTGKRKTTIPNADAAASARKQEALLEHELCESKAFKTAFKLDAVSRQFPVGLFHGVPSNESRVFTGGKSAIDIVATSAKALWLFELKAGTNVAMGALSELMLYAGLMRDARNGKVQFDKRRRSTVEGVSPESVRSCSAINAVILAENVHPLLSHGSIIDCVNDAIAARWTVDDKLPVRFGAIQIAQRQPDLILKPAPNEVFI